jgi:hypothetical protein
LPTSAFRTFALPPRLKYPDSVVFFPLTLKGSWTPMLPSTRTAATSFARTGSFTFGPAVAPISAAKRTGSRLSAPTIRCRYAPVLPIGLLTPSTPNLTLGILPLVIPNPTTKPRSGEGDNAAQGKRIVASAFQLFWERL